MIDDTNGIPDFPAGQRAKYEHVLAMFIRDETIRLDAPATATRCTLPCTSGYVVSGSPTMRRGWRWVKDRGRPTSPTGMKSTPAGSGRGYACSPLLSDFDVITGVPLFESPFVDLDAGIESGIGLRDPTPDHIYRIQDTDLDDIDDLNDLDPNGL